MQPRTPLHYGEAKFCLQHKIPVLCEKPLCLNAAECEDLVRTAKENNTFLMEGMWIRFLPFICKAQMLINENLLGDLLTVFASMNYKAPYDPGSRYFNPALGGGSLLDLGAYPVFLSALFLGKPEQICASATLTDQGVDKICSAILKYNSGAHAIIESSLIKNSDMPALITGTRGWMKIVHPWFEKSPGLQVELYTGEKYNFPFSWEGHGLHFESGKCWIAWTRGKWRAAECRIISAWLLPL
ncbi:MAG: Gfo/Idh/MocA family oxidoreductase [Bacteroidota bacterium]